jgi:hypothetical protein
MLRLKNFWLHYFKYKRVMLELKKYHDKKNKTYHKGTWYNYFFGSPVP